MGLEFKDGYVSLTERPKKLKKITGTRFAALLGFNKWATPFKTWAEITKVYEEPYEDTIYTIAGKTIEPIQHQYMRDKYFMTNLVSPEQVYGKDYFNKTFGDFYKDNKIFGGMWDALLVDENGKPTAVLEFKTTKRAEDWAEDLPVYYGLQGSLYAYLFGIERVIMVASFLEDQDYEHPEQFVPSASNTIVREFNVHEKYPEFDTYVSRCTNMYDRITISPYYDEDKDKDVLKAIRTKFVDYNADTLNELDQLYVVITEIKAQLEPYEKRYKAIVEKIKSEAVKQFGENDNNVVINSKRLVVNVAKQVRAEVDKKALESDGVLDKYMKNKTLYVASVKEIK